MPQAGVDGPGGSPMNIWIAPERNFLPARLEHFAEIRGTEKTVLMNVTRVREWREIASGIWLPQHVESVGYDLFAAGEDGEGPKVEESRGTYMLDTARLDPKHDDEFFRNVEMPDLVYVVKGGEIVAVEDSAKPVESRSRKAFLIVAGNLLIVLVVVAFLWYTRRRTTAK